MRESVAAWTQAGLSPSFGGLGLWHAEDMAHPAFLGSVIDTTQLVLSLLGKEAFTILGTSDAVSVFQTKWPNHISLSDGIMLGRLRSSTLSSETITDAPAKSQSSLQDIFDGNIWDALRAAAPVAGLGRQLKLETDRC